MNTLLSEIKSSLEDLKLGLTGALNITDAMETLSQSLSFNKVPTTWETKAYFSKKLLASWFADMIERCAQTLDWTNEIEVPHTLCISYLFNPMSFLTAIMQDTSRQTHLPLDDMVIITLVTSYRGPEEITKAATEGKYIHGLFLEGSAWEFGG